MVRNHRNVIKLHRNAFSSANHILWGPGPLKDVLYARSLFPAFIRQVFEDEFPTKKYVFAHRSLPDWDDFHYADLSKSFVEIFNSVGYGLKFIISYRDPRASSFSQVRRQFKHLIPPGTNESDIFRAARNTETHLTLLSAQLQKICEGQYLVLSYDLHMRYVRRKVNC
jgi:hypothetical protein